MFGLYIYYVELENSNLHANLKQLNTNWHYDKELSANEKHLTEEELIPLMELHQEDATTPYFEYVNEQLLKITESASVLELVDVDNEMKEDIIRFHSRQFDFGDRKCPVITHLINNVKATSSSQVSLLTIIVTRFAYIHRKGVVRT